ncbi:TetR/AcrR family transcriptional regulator [Flavobacterium sp. FlaQc-52]|uniref:TetR/AcrR family transcriptional regulator n=1 Tax=Flavobacterium sp. FlaQc-52 TaxID=3374185 RepID=UPI0037573569
MNTSEFILDKIAPVFNKQGYIGTSLSDITKATGLTKGAIYCNFANKEDLALQAFKLNVGIAIIPLFKLVATKEGAINKLHTITNYHRSYYDLLKDRGGCPMLRVSVDTKFVNPLLFEAAEKLSQKFINGLTDIINEGISKDEIQPDTDVNKYAQLILTMIEGSSLLAFTHNDDSYITHAMDFIDDILIKNIKK